METTFKMDDLGVPLFQETLKNHMSYRPQDLRQ